MSSLLHRSWDILSQHLLKASISLIFLLTTPHLQAIHDINHNGVSDLWEKKFNSGALYSTFIPTADPDGDGWTNAQEAAAGTDPGSGVPPIGHLNPTVTYTPTVYLSPAQPGGEPEILTPEAATITWPTVAGKKYTLLFSPDLESGTWIQIGSPRIGAGTEIGTSIALTQPDGSTPPRGFWRVTINDEDTDSDTLTNAEEAELGSNPNLTDTDGDGLSDVDELFVYHTNPSSPDTDGDGVSDSEEIASGHDPQSNQSYPPRLNVALRKASTSSGTVSGSLETNWPPYYYPSIFYYDMPVSSVFTWIATMPFPDQAPENLLPLASNGRHSFYGLYRAYDGSLAHCRYWLQTKPASNVEIKRTFLKITTGFRQPTVAPVYEELFPPVVEKLEVTIPANSTASLPIDILPPLDIVIGTNIVIGNGVNLLPVEVKNVRDAANAADDVNITPKQNATDTNIDSVAWIDNHTSATDSTPRMPQMRLSIPGLLDGVRIKAKLAVDYTRPYVGHQTQDLIRIPADGSFRDVTGSNWDIYADPDWASAVATGFFGGDATLTYQLTKPDGTILLQNQTILFRIAGQNPVDDRCKTYIVEQSGTAWFAYAIAKHESSLYGGEATYYPFTPVTPNNAKYNQFRALGGGQSGARIAGREGIPLVERAEAAGPGGIGMFQVTGSPTEETDIIPRAQIWNWQFNVKGGLAIMHHTAKSGLATRYFNDLQNDPAPYPTAYQANPPPTIHFGNTDFSSADAIWITAYNGWGAPINPYPVRGRYRFDPSLPAGLTIAPLTRTRRWYWNAPINPSEFYIINIERQLETTPN